MIVWFQKRGHLHIYVVKTKYLETRLLNYLADYESNKCIKGKMIKNILTSDSIMSFWKKTNKILSIQCIKNTC